MPEQRGPAGPLLGPARGLRRPASPARLGRCHQTRLRRRVPPAPGAAPRCVCLGLASGGLHIRSSVLAQRRCAPLIALQLPAHGCRPDARGAGGRAAGCGPRACGARGRGAMLSPGACTACRRNGLAERACLAAAPGQPRRVPGAAGAAAAGAARGGARGAASGGGAAAAAGRAAAAAPDQADRAARGAGRAAGRAGAVARLPGQPARACRCGLQQRESRVRRRE